jgi:excisionase family DNA binding protein
MVAQKGVPLAVGIGLTTLEDSRGLERKVYSVNDIASILGVSKEHIHRQIRAGLLPHKRIGRRVVIPCKLFEEWLNQGEEF